MYSAIFHSVDVGEENSPFLKKYVSSDKQHDAFILDFKKLANAQQLTSGNGNALTVAKRIYGWFTRNVLNKMDWSFIRQHLQKDFVTVLLKPTQEGAFADDYGLLIFPHTGMKINLGEYPDPLGFALYKMNPNGIYLDVGAGKKMGANFIEFSKLLGKQNGVKELHMCSVSDARPVWEKYGLKQTDKPCTTQKPLPDHKAVSMCEPTGKSYKRKQFLETKKKVQKCLATASDATKCPYLDENGYYHSMCFKQSGLKLPKSIVHIRTQ